MRKFIFAVFVGMLQVILICSICSICAAQEDEDGEKVTFQATLPDLDFFEGKGDRPITMIIESVENHQKGKENKKSKCRTRHDKKTGKVIDISCPEGETYHEDVVKERHFFARMLTISQESEEIKVGMDYRVEIVALSPDGYEWKYMVFEDKAKSTSVSLIVDSWDLRPARGDWVPASDEVNPFSGSSVEEPK